MLRFKTAIEKKIQASAVLARLEGGRIERLRLLKLLYIADRESLKERACPIIGGRVVAMNNGPLHSTVYNMIKGETEEPNHDWENVFKNDGHNVVLEQEPGRMELSDWEIEKLTAVSESHRSIDTWELAELTHGFREWQECHFEGSSRTIPLEKILTVLGFTADEIDEIQKEAEAHARMERLIGS